MNSSMAKVLATALLTGMLASTGVLAEDTESSNTTNAGDTPAPAAGKEGCGAKTKTRGHAKKKKSSCSAKAKNKHACSGPGGCDAKMMHEEGGKTE